MAPKTNTKPVYIRSSYHWLFMAQDMTFSRSAKNASPAKLQFGQVNLEVLIAGELFPMQPSPGVLNKWKDPPKDTLPTVSPSGSTVNEDGMVTLKTILEIAVHTIVKTEKAKAQGGQSAALNPSEKKSKGKAPATDPKIVIEDIESSPAPKVRAENLPSDKENSDNDPAEDSDTNIMKSPCPDPHLAPIYQNLPALP
ncbi:hypothetical protein L208DRAFT_1382886 [Tricholoma matsutake]|nr:hypothetical protein L208DRAFT_1382886 [Tricholoma matsutake 945]